MHDIRVDIKLEDSSPLPLFTHAERRDCVSDLHFHLPRLDSLRLFKISIHSHG
jgi:hypothetical protein